MLWSSEEGVISDLGKEIIEDLREEAELLTVNAVKGTLNPCLRPALIFCMVFPILVNGLTAHSFAKPLEVIPTSSMFFLSPMQSSIRFC